MAGGLYLIRLSPFHYYGGRSCDFEARWRRHLDLLLAGKHYNAYMQNVFNKHGTFDPEVLQELETLEEQTEAEQTWLEENFGSPGCLNLSGWAFGGSESGTIWVNDGEKTRKVDPSSIPKGWERGRLDFAPTRGHLWIHLGNRAKVIPPEEVSTYEGQGWALGFPPLMRGLIWLRSPETEERCRVRPEEVSKYVDEGWVLGLGSLPARYWIHRIREDETERRRVAEEQVPAYLKRGWSLGSAMPNVQCLLWVHRLDEDGSSLQRRILEEDVDFFLDSGWVLGQARFTEELVWIRRGLEEDWSYKRVPASTLPDWIQKGWERGFREHTEEHRERVREAWTEERRGAQRERILQSPIPQPDAEARKRAGEKLRGQRAGVPLSEEHRQALSEAQTARWERDGTHSDAVKRRIGEKARARYEANPEAWGHSEETRAKISELSRGRIWVNNGERNRFVPSEEADVLLASGWDPGRKGKKAPPEIQNIAISESKHGRVWVNNGSVTRMVQPDEASSLLASGEWVRGRA
jgi:hypothetical protein